MVQIVSWSIVRISAYASTKQGLLYVHYFLIMFLKGQTLYINKMI